MDRDSPPLNVLDLNDFVLMQIFSYLTEFEKYFCSKVCQRWTSIALSTFSKTMIFDSQMNEYFLQPSGDRSRLRENLKRSYDIIKALGNHWKHVRISHSLMNLSVTKILKMVKKFCPNMEHLLLQFDTIESNCVLRGLPRNLKRLSLSAECLCKENWLTPLRDCVGIEELTLEFITKKRKILRGDFLENLSNLKVLIFNGCRPSVNGLRKCFRNANMLASLELNCEIVNVVNGLNIILSNLKNLQRLKLQPMQSLRIDRLGLLPKLKFLTLTSWVPNDLNSLLRNLISMNVVERFELDNCQSFIHSDVIYDIHKWTSLIYLQVDYVESFDDRFLRQLAKSGNLNFFHFSGRSRNVTVEEIIHLITKSLYMEKFDFQIYYERSDGYIPDTGNDVERIMEFRKCAQNRIKNICVYNTPISVHCSGSFLLKNEIVIRQTAI
ncbi:hypothetical protein Bhyg_15408 [Pseudolycoriella hygida]|uniref:F-box domain-containing protein n=1 Tax=Pseudolycoriella hygida TaxID=35572 RepID=A0A9Q0MRS5_9DIPT|nr:hypothetical protein Bhyg_15408 [Pseudolycoriella hygida]